MKRALIAIMALIWILISAGKIGVADSKFVCVVHRGEWVWVREAPDKDAAKKQGYLKENGALIRKFAISGGALRITAGNRDENELVIKLLSECK